MKFMPTGFAKKESKCILIRKNILDFLHGSYLPEEMKQRLDNKTIDKLFESITPQLLDEISKEGSFDFHTISVAKLLGVKGSTKVLQAILGNELRRLLT